MNSLNSDGSARTSVFRRVGTYIPMMIILGLAVPAIIYLTIMQSMGWGRPALGANGVTSYTATSSDSIILYAAPNTRTYFAGTGGNYETLLVPWRNYFANRKIDFKEFDDIARLKKEKEGVLILPSAVSLSEEERAEIMAFRSRGGAILSTWATGTRNGNGEWEGWKFLENTGVSYVGEIPVGSEINQLILSGESPLSHTHPSGQRILMGKTSEPLLRVKGEMVAGRFMNWARITDEDRKEEGAVVFSETADNSGRTAFFAFAESTWESRPIPAFTLIDDALLWLQRKPVMMRAAWPNGKLAAQVVEMDTEQGFDNAGLFADMMSSFKYPATFYVLTSVGKLYPEVLARLARDFEIGFHGDVHDSFKGQSPALQEQRIQVMRTEMATTIPAFNLKEATGFRAPTEGYDANTELLIHKYGIRHHAADPNRSEARLPLFAKMDGVKTEDALVVLPRTQRDDINLHWEKLSVEQTTQALINDFDLTLNTGALGLLSVHSQNFTADGTLTKAMPAYLEYLQARRDQVWLASAGTVAEWWRERERFKVTSSYNGKRIEFDITITGKKPFAGASLIVMVPKKGVLPAVQSVKIDMVKPAVVRIDDYRAAIIFNDLNPGNYAYQVTFSK